MTSSHKLIPSEIQETAPSEVTHGTMFHGRVALIQHRRGYRYSVDAVLLSHFVAQQTPIETLDVGTGCGVIPLLLSDLWEQAGQTPHITAVERQPSLATLARQNTIANHRQSQIEIIETDIRHWTPNQNWHLITCNPPFFAIDSGNMSPNPERAAARHELHGSLEELIATIASHLHPEGNLSLVYPAPSLPRLVQACQAAQLTVCRQQLVHPRVDTPAKLALVSVSFDAKQCHHENPLYLYHTTEHRHHTPEAEAIFAGLHKPR